MEIYFDSNSLKTCLEKSKKGRKKFGTETYEKIIMRLQEIRAIKNMTDLFKLPALRLHQLKGQRKGQWAIDVDKNNRIAFYPLNNEDQKIKGDIDFDDIVKISVVFVGDYHD